VVLVVRSDRKDCVVDIVLETWNTEIEVVALRDPCLTLQDMPCRRECVELRVARSCGIVVA
jgi:hypothetical protein